MADKQQTRRELILDAAIRLFRRSGYEATGIDDIGAAAGITGPGVYRHFSSKQEILDECVTYGASEVLQHADEILSGDLAPRQALDALVSRLVDDVLSRPDMVTVLLRERRHLSPAAKGAWTRAVNDYQSEWRSVLGALRPDLDDDAVAAVIWMALGMALAAAQYDTGYPRDELAAVLHDMLVGSLLGPSDR
ncbi:MAG: TetR/AcrR family transcriptional regulator [Acidimicrobiia bacterium]|nr:TetR/AcrR family transcriptional regulator [Acidimicrobiia bacterium]